MRLVHVGNQISKCNALLIPEAAQTCNRVKNG